MNYCGVRNRADVGLQEEGSCRKRGLQKEISDRFWEITTLLDLNCGSVYTSRLWLIMMMNFLSTKLLHLVTEAGRLNIRLLENKKKNYCLFRTKEQFRSKTFLFYSGWATWPMTIFTLCSISYFAEYVPICPFLSS